MERPPSHLYHAIRFLLAITFLVYGFSKLVNGQFNPALYSDELMAMPARDLSGFQLTWLYFGHSRPYQCFVGTAEVLAALLLAFYRTAPIGAAIYFPIIVNVVAVDVFYRIDGPLFVAIPLFLGNLVLLYADRSQVRQAVTSLLRPANDQITWRQSLLGGCLAAALVLAWLVTVVTLNFAVQTIGGGL